MRFSNWINTRQTPKAILEVCIALGTLDGYVSAGLLGHGNHATVSRDGSRLLVMVHNDADPKDVDPATVTLADGRTVSLQKTFARSGAYDARSLQPIWQVDWYAMPEELVWSDDFDYVARRNTWGYHRGIALSFYCRGNLTREYTVTELLTGLASVYCLPYETYGWYTRWHEKFELHGDQLLLTTPPRRLYVSGRAIPLGRQELYKFNLKSGAIIASHVIGRWVLWSYCVIAAVILLAPVGYLAWRARTKQQPE